jgi:hypothetical protein
MSNVFGGGQKTARADARKVQASARREKQTSSEETVRAQQRAERGSGGRSGRARLMGNLGAQLKGKLGE